MATRYIGVFLGCIELNKDHTEVIQGFSASALFMDADFWGWGV